jgi:hypothetical protein
MARALHHAVYNFHQSFGDAPSCIVLVCCRGEDGAFPATHTVFVQDNRTRSGDTAAVPHVISQLPFDDVGDSSAFTDDYGCLATVRSSTVEHMRTW